MDGLQNGIERVSPRNLSVERFRREFMETWTPVIYEGLCESWPARRWTPDYFRRRFPDRQVRLDEASSKAHYLPMAEYMDLVDASEPISSIDRWQAGVGDPIPPYARGLFLVEEFPELLDEFEYLPHFQPNWFRRSPLREILGRGAEFWADPCIGPAGASSPTLHSDAGFTHNWFLQIYGVKHFWTFPFDRGDRIYHGAVDSWPPDLLRFPLAEGVEATELELHPGDLLFIPAGLWHTTQGKTASISLSGNFLNASNIDRYLSTQCWDESLKTLIRVSNEEADRSRVPNVPLRFGSWDRSPFG